MASETASPSVHVAWLDLGEGGWARAFETGSPGAYDFWRLFQESYKAGARRSRILPAGAHPDDTPMPATPSPPAMSVWAAGEGGGPPRIDVSRAAGWLCVGGRWREVVRDADLAACVGETQRLSAEHGHAPWQVLPEGHTPEVADANLMPPAR